MCRERPGPRCSDGGWKRYQKAKTNFELVNASYQSSLEQHSGDTERVPRRLRAKMSRASNRLNAAQQVYWATPHGQDELRERQGRYQAQLDSNFPSGAPEDESTSEYLRWKNLDSSVRRTEKRINEGIERRRGSYSDLKLVKGERRVLREQATARGGHLGRNAHPLSEANATSMREQLDAHGVSLREWNEDDVSRASSWVEHGSDASFRANTTVRPFQQGRDEDGNRVQLGRVLDDVKPVSRTIRVNSPDGQVVEARHDIFLTKNDNGQYIVSVRSRAVSSWEDASPIDNTKQDLGHLLTDRRLSHVESKHVYSVSTSKAEAKRSMTQAKRSHRSAQVTALMGRDILTARAARRSTSLQRRGIVIWHRFQNPAYAGA